MGDDAPENGLKDWVDEQWKLVRSDARVEKIKFLIDHICNQKDGNRYIKFLRVSKTPINVPVTRQMPDKTVSSFALHESPY